MANEMLGNGDGLEQQERTSGRGLTHGEALGGGRKIRVLLAHNRYIYRGGEDAVVDAECELLRSRGHETLLYLEDNKELAKRNAAIAAIEAIWSFRASRKLRELIRQFQPDIIHVHNTFPQLSPSIFWTANACGIPIVLTLHNYRYACAQGAFLRKGRICEDCVGRIPFRGIARRCYRHSYAQSLVLVASFAFHRAIGTYRNKVTSLIALSEFGIQKHIECGMPRRKVLCKVNFIDVTTEKAATPRMGGLFVGRLSVEKGIDVLLQALDTMSSMRLRIVGDGPLTEDVRRCRHMEFLGWKNNTDVYSLMQSASYLVLPSTWYEGFPRTIAEAYACGLPVIGTRLGPMPEIIEHGVTGLLFEPGSAQDLAEKMLWAEAHPEEMAKMGQRAREVHAEKYTSETNYRQLISIYSKVIRERKQGVSGFSGR